MAAIVHNAGVNYSLYYNVLNYFKTIMNNHPSIQVVTQGLIEDFDTKEFPQYPVGNVSILNANIIGTITEYDIQLIIADKIKNKNNESEGVYNKQNIPFYGVDDVVDIHANTFGIINDLTAYTAKSVDGFEINDTILNEPFEDRFNNGLAGWVSTFTLTVHNDRNRCLFFLISPDGSGYKIQDCLTSDYKYAVISGSVSVGDYFSSKIGTSTNCFYVDSQVTEWDDWDYVNLKALDFYGSCIECQTGILPTTTSTTTLQPTTSTTTIEPTTSTTTLVPTTSTTTVEPTTSTTTIEPTTSTTTLVPSTSTTTVGAFDYITVAGRSPIANATVTYQTYDEPGVNKTVNIVGYSSFTWCGSYISSTETVQILTGRSCPFNDPAPSSDCTSVTFTNNSSGTILIANYYPCNSSTYTTLTVNPLSNTTVCASHLDLLVFNSSANRLLTTGSSC